MASAGAIAAKLELGMRALKAAAERIKEAVPEAPALILPEWRDADYERAEQMEALGQWMTGLADLVAPVAEVEPEPEPLPEGELPTEPEPLPEGELPTEPEPLPEGELPTEPEPLPEGELPTEPEPEAKPKSKKK